MDKSTFAKRLIALFVFVNTLWLAVDYARALNHYVPAGATGVIGADTWINLAGATWFIAVAGTAIILYEFGREILEGSHVYEA